MAFPRTPNPTAEQILDIYLPMVGDNLDEAMEEIRVRLEQDLPGAVDLKNQRRGWFGIAAKAIPQAAKYHIAPADLAKDHINCVLIGVSSETNPQGLGGAYKNEIEVVVYTIDKKSISPGQILMLWRRAALIRGVLRAYHNGCVNTEGILCWRSLKPSGYSMIPTEWREFSGLACNFRMVIPPTQASP